MFPKLLRRFISIAVNIAIVSSLFSAIPVQAQGTFSIISGPANGIDPNGPITLEHNGSSAVVNSSLQFISSQTSGFENLNIILEDVDFVDANTGWAIGTRTDPNTGDFTGYMLKTTDGGNTWTTNNLGALWPSKIKFIDANTGWMIDSGNSGTYKTTDGGANWISKSITGSSNSFQALDAFDSNTACVANSGVIHCTRDGGNTWSDDLWTDISPYGAYLNFRNISFGDANTAYIASSNRWPSTTGTVQKLTWDGNAWTVTEQTMPDATMDLYKIKFVDGSTGYAATYGRLVKTVDGGTTWNVVITPGFSSPQDLEFIDGNTGWIATDNYSFLSTTDGGATWTEKSYTDDLIYAFEFFDINNGVGVGDDLSGLDQSGALTVKTTDGGTNWTHVANDLQNTNITLRSVSFAFDQSVGYAVGDKGAIIKTYNGGTSWGNVPNTGLGENDVVTTVMAIDPTITWIAGYNTQGIQGQDGFFKWTTNGGTTWNTQTGNIPAISDFLLIDNNTIYAVGPAGQIIKTTDGGANWTGQVSGTGDALNTITTGDGIAIYATGINGVVVKTTDEGATWNPVTTGISQNISDAFFSDNLTGYIVSNVATGTMLKTTDGGTTWTSMTPVDPGDDYYSITSSLTDPNTLYIGGSNSRMYKSTDAGSTWSVVTTRDDTLYHIARGIFAIGDTVWTVGDYGRIGKYDEKISLRARSGNTIDGAPTGPNFCYDGGSTSATTIECYINNTLGGNTYYILTVKGGTSGIYTGGMETLATDYSTTFQTGTIDQGAPPEICGNAICSAVDGETPASCPTDCSGGGITANPNTVVSANDPATPVILNPGSAATAVLGINVDRPAENVTLNNFRFIIETALGFNPETGFNPLDNTANSGIALWNDGTGAPNDGTFSISDDMVVGSTVENKTPGGTQYSKFTPFSTNTYSISGAANITNPPLVKGDIIWIADQGFSIVTNGLTDTAFTVNFENAIGGGDGSTTVPPGTRISKFGDGGGYRTGFTYEGGSWLVNSGNYTPELGDLVVLANDNDQTVHIGIVTDPNQSSFQINNGQQFLPTTNNIRYQITEWSENFPLKAGVGASGEITDGMNFTEGDVIYADTGSGYGWHMVTTGENVAIAATPTTLRLDYRDSTPTFAYSSRIVKLTPVATGKIADGNPQGINSGDLVFNYHIDPDVTPALNGYQWDHALIGGTSITDTNLRFTGGGGSPTWPWIYSITPNTPPTIPGDDMTLGNVGFDFYVTVKTAGAISALPTAFLGFWPNNTENMTLSDSSDTTYAGSSIAQTNIFTIEAANPAPTDDHGNTEGTATSVIVNPAIPEAGNLEVDKYMDTDYFSFLGTSGENYTVTVSLYTLAGATFNVSGVGGYNSGQKPTPDTVNFTAASTGTYYIYVTSGGSGTYGVTVESGVTPPPGGTDDFENTAATATGSLWMAMEQSGNIETSGDEDFFRISASPGTTYTIDTSLYTLPTGWTYLYGSDGVTVLDSAQAPGRITHTANQMTLYVRVSNQGTMTGTYGVTLNTQAGGGPGGPGAGEDYTKVVSMDSLRTMGPLTASSTSIEAIGLNLARQNGTSTLDSISLFVTGTAGFRPNSDLNGIIGQNPNSGIALWRDGSSAGASLGEGSFDRNLMNDDELVPSTISSANTPRISKLTPVTTGIYDAPGGVFTTTPALNQGDIIYIGQGNRGQWGMVTNSLTESGVEFDSMPYDCNAGPCLSSTRISNFEGSENTVNITTGTAGDSLTVNAGTYVPAVGDIVFYHRQTEVNQSRWGIVTNADMNIDNFTINGSLLNSYSTYQITKFPSAFNPTFSNVGQNTLTEGMTFTEGDLIYASLQEDGGYEWHLVTVGETVGPGGAPAALRLDGSRMADFDWNTIIAKITPSEQGPVTAGTPLFNPGDILFGNRIVDGIATYTWDLITIGGNGGADSAVRVYRSMSEEGLEWLWQYTITPDTAETLPTSNSTEGYRGMDYYITFMTSPFIENGESFYFTWPNGGISVNGMNQIIATLPEPQITTHRFTVGQTEDPAPTPGICPTSTLDCPPSDQPIGPLDDYGNTTITAEPVEPNNMGVNGLMGEIENTDDIDYFRFNAAAGESYTVSVSSLVAMPPGSGNLYIYDMNGIQTNDTSFPGGMNINFTPAVGGIYYVAVSSTMVGTYTIQITSIGGTGGSPPPPPGGGGFAPQLLISYPSNGEMSFPIEGFIDFYFDTDLDENTLTTANITMTENGTAKTIQISPIWQGLRIGIPATPQFTSNSQWARIATADLNSAVREVASWTGAYSPANGDIVLWQKGSFPPILGIYDNVGFINGESPMQGDRITRINAGEQTGNIGEAMPKPVSLGDLVVASLWSDWGYNWHIVTDEGDLSDLNDYPVQFDGSGINLDNYSFYQTKFSSMTPDMTATDNGSAGGGTALVSAGMIVFANLASEGYYRWHLVTEGGLMSSDPGENTAGIDNNTPTNSLVTFESQISQLGPINWGDLNTISPFEAGDVIFAKTDSGSGYNGGYGFHMVSRAGTSITDPNLGLDSSTGMLNPGGQYEITIGTGVQANMTNTPLENPITINFGTSSITATNYTAPYVSETTPGYGESNYSRNAPLTVTFSVPMATEGDGSILENANVGLYESSWGSLGNLITTTNNYDAETWTVTLDPGGNLAANSEYILRVNTTAKSSTGTSVGWENWVYFSTGSGIDSDFPTVTGIYPGNNSENVDQQVIIAIGVSEDLDPSSVNTSNITLRPTIVGSNVEVNLTYSEKMIQIAPKQGLNLTTGYQVTVSGITDTTGHAIEVPWTSQFTTSSLSAGISTPIAVSTNADSYNVAVTFSEPMQSGGGSNAADNITNYSLESPEGTPISLANKTVTYNSSAMTATITGLALVTGNNFTLTMTNMKDSLGETIAVEGETIYGSIFSTAETGGNLGPGGGATQAWDEYGMSPTNAWPQDRTAGALTSYHIGFQAEKNIPGGGQIVLTFPIGFNVENAVPDPNSWDNMDINGYNQGDTVTISGVTANKRARTVTVTTAGGATGADSYIGLDIAGITNSEIVTEDGYTIDIKTKDSAANNRKNLESKTTGKFYLNERGNDSLTVTVINDENKNGQRDPGEQVAGDGVEVFLYGYATGNKSGTTVGGTVTFGNLQPDWYEVSINLESATNLGYIANSWPEWVYVEGVTERDLFVRTVATSISGTITGPENEQIDVFAYGIEGNWSWIKKTYTISGGSVEYSLPVEPGAVYRVGVEPAMDEKAMMNGGGECGATNFNFIPPSHQEIKIEDSASNLDFVLIATNRTIAGQVVDAAGTGINKACIYASPVETDANGSTERGFGIGGATDANGNFSLNVTPGTYLVGAYKWGMPYVDDQQTDVAESGPNSPASLTFQMKMEAQVTISGRILDEAGNPIPYGSVWGHKIESTTDRTIKANSANDWTNGGTDETGTYTLYVGEGTWEIEAYAPGPGKLPNKVLTVSNVNLTGQDFSVADIVKGTVQGNVSVEGVAQEGAYIYASGDNGWNSVTSDSSGNYSLDLPVGTYTLECWIPNYGNGSRTENLGITANNTITGQNCSIESSITVTVNLTDGQNPIQNAMVSLKDESQNKGNETNVSAISGNNAVYSITVPQGNYMLRVGHPKYGPIGEEDNVSTTQTFSFTTGSRLYAVTGAVVSGGSGLADAAVTIYGTPDETENTIQDRTMTDASGNFTINVPNGTYTLHADKTGYVSNGDSQITVDNASISDGTLILEPSQRTISGTIMLNGNPVSGAFVDAVDGNGGYAVSETDVSGNFTLQVKDGTWTANAHAEGAEAENIKIVVSEENSTGNIITLIAIEGYTTKEEEASAVRPSSGGIVQNADIDSDFKVTIPANTLGSSNNSATVQTRATTALPNPTTGTVLKTNGISINAVDASGQPIKTLTGEVTIVIPYDETGIPAGTREENLIIGVWNTATKNYDTLATTVDKTANTLTARVNHFSDFAPLLPSAGAPATPSGLAAVNEGSGTKVNLSWNTVAGTALYNIYRSTDNVIFPNIGTSATNSYQATGLTAGTQYWFKVSAQDNATPARESAASSAVNITPANTQQQSQQQQQLSGGGGGGGGYIASAQLKPGPSFTKDLKKGSSGEDVAKLQNFLEEKGFLKLPKNTKKGAYDKFTEEAVQKYQKSVKIKPTGILGPVTREQLKKDILAKEKTAEEKSKKSTQKGSLQKTEKPKKKLPKLKKLQLLDEEILGNGLFCPVTFGGTDKPKKS